MNVETEFEIGDEVFITDVSQAGQPEPCPACDGDELLTVKFADGEEVPVQCPHCSGNGSVPRMVYKGVAVKADVVDVSITNKGVSYGVQRRDRPGHYRRCPAEELWTDHDKCKAQAEKFAAALNRKPTAKEAREEAISQAANHAAHWRDVRDRARQTVMDADAILKHAR